MQNNLANKTLFQIIHGDCEKELGAFSNQVDLIITSPPYADARKQHYNSIAPSDYADWFISFHSAFLASSKTNRKFSAEYER
ncbi:hypothetical protein [Rickettsiella endosymbiont of Xylota segnis]|uniref:hypothetical protein n=1 Tax=Rickettsiella endosymbiont of Xylota segnis TaxID=3066238 RepID=UPI0030D3F29E